MKRIISIILVSALCLAVLSVSAFTASADANTINISRVNSYDGSTDIVVWASTVENSTVQSIYGSANDVTFNYWYFILLEYNSFSASYRVVDTSGFDAYGNSTRPDENYTTWTLGSNRIAIMAKTQASDADGLALLKSMSTGDTLYLNKSVVSLASTYGAVSNVYASTQYVEIEDDNQFEESSEPEDPFRPGTESSEPSEEPSEDVSEDVSEEPEFESVLDIDLAGPEMYKPGDEITVTATVNNITEYNGISLISFNLKYDREKLTLTNDVIESNYDELDCVTAVPNANKWENLSYARNGIVYVQLLTAYYDFEYYALEDGDIEFTFTFTVKDDATGNIEIGIDEDSIVVGASTVESVNKFTGNGSSLVIAEDISKFDVVVEGPESYLPNGEITVAATITNFAQSGVSLIEFPLEYATNILSLKNEVNESNYNELDCVVSLPNDSWENLSCIKNGRPYIQLLTTETDSSYFLKKGDEIELVFTFSVSEEASGPISIGVDDEDIVGAVNTANDIEKFVGSGSYININERNTSFDIVLDAPETCKPGDEITVTADISNIVSGKGVSLVKFDIKYNRDALTLTNGVDSSNDDALDCVVSLPNDSWENLTFAKNGVITVQLLTAEIDDSLFAKEDGEISLTFTFTVAEGFEGDIAIYVDEDSIVGATNTKDSYKTVQGYGDEVVIESSAVSYIIGDVNSDGQITITDYITAKRAVMGTYTLNETQTLAADIDGNGSINITDYIILKRYVMGTYVIA